MSGTTISGSSTVGLTLTSSNQNPVLIEQAGAIVTSATDAIYAGYHVSLWTIANLGTVSSTHTPEFGAGVFVAGTASAAITNGSALDSTALISGTVYGVVISGNGSIANYATISGANKYGVRILGSGTVVNGSEAGTAAVISGLNAAVELVGNDCEVLNEGTLTAAGGTAVEGLSQGIIVNGSETDKTALISGVMGGVELTSGTVVNWGTIESANSGASNYGITLLHNSSTIINHGVINADAGIIEGPGDTLVNDGTIIASGTNDLAVYFIGSSRAVVDPGAVFEGTVRSAGTITMELASGTRVGTIAGLGKEFLNTQTIAIDAGAQWLISGNSAGLASGQTVSGFATGDTLILDGFTATSHSYVSGIGLELDSGTNTITLDLAGSFSTDSFTVTDVLAGTEVTICYLPGTMIKTTSGERPIEDLRLGDLVFTRCRGIQPVKWIGRQSYASAFLARSRLPVRIAAGALGRATPDRELWVSPGHSMLLENKLILARNLVNGVNITQGVFSGPIEYYAVELENHDCIMANGAWGETYADGPGLRNQFHNRGEFYALFPDYIEPEEFRLCAPRPEAGIALEEALMPFFARLNITPGPLQYNIEITGPRIVEGWAFDEANPDTPVVIEIAEDGIILGTALACHYRHDLAAAGFGRGYCMFSFALPERAFGPFEIRRASDGAPLYSNAACFAAA